MRPVLAITAVELRRFLRDRSNIFFVFIFPLVLVLVIGSQFGGGGSPGRVVLVGEGSDLRTAVVTALEDDGVAVALAAADDALEQVARGRADVVVQLERADADAFAAGGDVTLDVVASSQAGAPATVERVRTAVQAVTVQQGQLAALTAAGADEAAAQSALGRVAGALDEPRLEVVDVDEVAQELSGLGQFDVGAASQVLLFVFLISLAGSTTLIQARRYGVVGRTLTAPVSTTQLLAGQALGRFVIALFQGAYIMAATALLFGVDWGNLWLSAVVLAAFAAAAAGAAMLLGSLLDNENAAVGAGIGLGLVLAALGGGMLPLELFPDSLRGVSLATPHAWAYEAFAEIQRHDGTLADVAPQLAVLLAMAVALLGIGSWALRRSLSRAM
ncbi:ABC-2 type transport system permease protein [Georgenia soli]|uniref:ABC-2 type transport system permease protein n=1 Tax=Georgenia soli TaxID=638953 RepID=A0A2A9ERL6_9MICO|nr:ABC transporter permease [Georgenia soli]PFG41181.1 ABC-2 type transport system permease protein [Georgenia soli]